MLVPTMTYLCVCVRARGKLADADHRNPGHLFSLIRFLPGNANLDCSLCSYSIQVSVAVAARHLQDVDSAACHPGLGG